MSGTRIEKDSFGPIEVPAERLWGAQTERSRRFFRISGERMPLAVVYALALVKQAAAAVNAELGLLEPDKAARDRAAPPTRCSPGSTTTSSRWSVWQTGSGTQTNMNVNEVLANRASELLGGERGAEAPGAPERRRQPRPVLERRVPHRDARRRGARGAQPAAAGARRRCARRSQAKSARVSRHREDRPHAPAGRHAAHARPGVLRLRGAARPRARRAATPRCRAAARAGARRHRGRHRAQRASANSRARVCERIASATGLPFVTAPNKFEALAGHEPLVFAHGALKTLAAALIKIANDIRCSPRARARGSASSASRRTSRAARSCRAR